MKTIGMIGGVSWVSSIDYYQIMNSEVSNRLGGYHSAKLIMYSVENADIVAPTIQQNWDNIEKIIVSAAKSVEKAGADFLIICCNTIHKVADEVQNHIRIPLLHIANVTAQKIKTQGLKKVGLLGTRNTMEDNFYKDILTKNYGLEIVIPNEEEIEIIDRVIFNELCFNKIKQSSKEQYITIINHLIKKGAEGIVLGCTELRLLIQEKDSIVPLFDTTKIHAVAAVEYALG